MDKEVKLHRSVYSMDKMLYNLFTCIPVLAGNKTEKIEQRLP